MDELVLNHLALQQNHLLDANKSAKHHHPSASLFNPQNGHPHQQNIIISLQLQKESQTKRFQPKPVEQQESLFFGDEEEGERDYLEGQQQIYRNLLGEEEQQLFPVLSKLEQVEEKKVQPDALQYDIKLGWMPRSQITGPIPLSFQNELNDLVIAQKQRSLIYLGYRPTNTFEVHKAFYGEGKNYPFYQFHLCKSLFLERFFKKYYSQYDFVSQRLEGMVVGGGEGENSSLLVFDSFFEGGNLDAVYYEGSEYRLMLRVDSNTVGHCNYYNFKVACRKAGKYRFRIMNLNKHKTLYERGMRPYVRNALDEKSEWQQAGSNIKFGESPLREEFEVAGMLSSLRFQYEFLSDQCCVQFCYSIPFTYSNLIVNLQKWKNSPFLHANKLCHTLSGVQIPILTITEHASAEEPSSVGLQEGKNKFIVAITGRIHPGQANGSHIVNGLINSLIKDTKESNYLRKNVVFKVIPMINPDGVIVGNTRTSFAGKDLNRKYSNNPQFVFPEVVGIKDYMTKLKEKYQEKFLFLIDIHGHSARKNSFFFGPEYPIMEEQYTKCRLLPRLYSVRTEVFRYYSCKFKISSAKQSTARGYFNSHGIRAYTHETSTHCYFNFSQRKDLAFTRKDLEKLGEDMAGGIHDYLNLIYKEKKEVEKIIEKEREQERQEKSLRAQKKKELGIDEEEDDSDKMGSDKADSESEADDVQDKKIQQFYNRINENKEYFYEELVKINKKDREEGEGDSRKDKRRNKNKEKEREERELQLQRELDQRESELILIKKRHAQNQQRIDWASKASYSKKSINFQEYEGLSNVIFGSGTIYNPQSHKQIKLLYEGQRSTNNFRETKYTFKNVEANFNSTKQLVKSPSPQHKIFKSIKNKRTSQFFSKKSSDFNDNNQEESSYSALEKDKQAMLQQLRLQKDLLIQTNKKLIQKEDLERLLAKSNNYNVVKPLPILSIHISEGEKDRGRERKEIQSLGNNLKRVTRKKSLKTLKRSQEHLAKKISRNLQSNTLTRNLPSLGSLFHNF